MEKSPFRISILGCGWYGLTLGKILVEKGYPVKGSVRDKKYFSDLLEEGVKPFLINLGASDEEQTVIDEYFFDTDVLVICFPPKRMAEIEMVYSYQFSQFLSYIKDHTKVILISSTSVYGPAVEEMTETHELKPVKKSGKALVAVEKMCREFLGDRLTILRFAGLIGPQRMPGQFLSGKKNIANGNSPVNLVHLVDCIGITCHIIEGSYGGEIFNVCASMHPLRRDYYCYWAQKMNLAAPEFLEDNSSEYKVVSNSKVKKMLSYQFTYDDLFFDPSLDPSREG